MIVFYNLWKIWNRAQFGKNISQLPLLHFDIIFVQYYLNASLSSSDRADQIGSGHKSDHLSGQVKTHIRHRAYLLFACNILRRYMARQYMSKVELPALLALHLTLSR